MRPTPAGAALAALIAGALLAVDPSGLAPFGPAKWLVVSTALAATIALASWSTLRVERRTALAWLVFLGLVAVAAAFGADPVYAWIGTPERRFGAITWALCALVFFAAQSIPARDHRWITGAAAAGSAAVGMWVIAELLGWEPTGLVGAGDRPIGPLGSSAYLGAAAALLGPVALGLRSRFGTAAAALAGVALVASGARAAWVGVLVAAAVYAVVRRPRVDWRRLAAASVLILALAAATGVLARVPDLANSDDGGVVGRLDEWRVAVRMIADHPVVGVGPEGYRIEFGRAVDDAYERAHGRRQLPDRAHSAALDVAATTGIPGVVAYALVIGCLAPIVGRALRSEQVDLVCMATGVVAHGVQSLFLFPVAELDPLAWALAGLVVARTAGRARRLVIPAPRGAAVIAGAVAIAALVAGTLDVIADRRARDILDGHALTAGAAADLRPDVLRYWLVAQRAHESVGDVDAAVADLDRAGDWSRRDPVVRSEQARLLLDLARRTGDADDVAAARAAFDHLLDDDPRNAVVLLRAGVARALDGDHDAAETAWLAAEDLAPSSAAASTNLAVSYAEQGRWSDARAAARRALARAPDDRRARAVLEQIAEEDGT